MNLARKSTIILSFSKINRRKIQVQCFESFLVGIKYWNFLGLFNKESFLTIFVFLLFFIQQRIIFYGKLHCFSKKISSGQL
jgi:hypothetical protein